MAQRPHICFVSPQLYPVIARRNELGVVGGAEIQQALIARALVARGYRVTVVSFEYGQNDGDVVDGIRMVTLFNEDDGLPGLRALHPRMTGIWSALRRADADIYYQRTAAMLTGVISLFTRTYGRRSVYAAAADVDFVPGREKIRDPWYRALFRYGVRRVDRVIAQNPGQIRSALAHHRIEPLLIPSMYVPLGTGRASALARDVLWCGMMRDVKRPDLVLELARRLPDIRFRMVGGPVASDDGRAAWQRIQTAAPQLPNLVVEGFLPYEEADERFVGARVFINTSISEGFPNTFLQAWSRGVPTLSFVDVGSVDADGVAVGEVCRDLDHMAERLRTLMGDDAAWQQASQRAHRYFEARHSVEATMTAYERLFAELMGASAQALEVRA
jgi:glycosyltransferase involved in cell wall biosynthesis